MKSFFANVWVKRVVSAASVLYAAGACGLCYYSLFYDIHIHNKVSLCLMLIGISIVALVLMLYSRKQILTRISSFIILPAMLPVVLLYFGNWGMIIPIIITGLIILLMSGAGEGAKTAIGTTILLLYIFGALGYFLFTSFFVTSAKETEIESGISPSGRYRYRVVNTEDSSNGSTAVYVEPNDADVEYPFVTFTLKNMEKVVHLDRPVCEEIDVQWVTQTRQEITEQLNQLSDAIVVHLSEDELEDLGYTYDSKLQLADLTYSRKTMLGLTASDVDPIYLDTLTEEQLAMFGIGKESSGKYYIISPSQEVVNAMKKKNPSRYYFSELTAKALRAYNNTNTDDYGNILFKVQKNNTVYLNTLTDAQLDMIGVPESGDVMIFNGETCFRYYISDIEDYFDVDSRHLSLDLLT